MARTDDWLADDEGNLRRDVARQINANRVDRLIRDGPATPDDGGWERIRQVIGVCGLVLGMVLIACFIFQELYPPVGRVVARGVVLQEDPSETAPAVGELALGEALKIKESSEGWYRVRALPDRSGWVFAGYVVRHGGPWLGPGILLEPFTVHRTRLEAGNVVLIEKSKKKHATLLLADGTRFVVAATDVVALEALE